MAEELFEIVPAERLRDVILGAPGLIIGAGAVYYPGVLGELAEVLANYGKLPTGPVFDIVDRLKEVGVPEDDIRGRIREFFEPKKAAPQIPLLARIAWRAVLSATWDLRFETIAQQEAEGKPTRHPIAVIPDVSAPVPPRTIPSFKLLGSLPRQDFVCDSTGYRKRRRLWRFATKGFVDRLKLGPVLCVGMSEQVDLLLDLLAETSDPGAAPTQLLFLQDDPLVQNRSVSGMLRPRTVPIQLRASLSDFAQAIEKARSTGYTSSLFSSAEPDASSALAEFDDFVTVVNEHLETTTTLAEQNRLHDLLFAPSLPRWDPYVHGLDFRRTIEPSVVKNVVALAQDRSPGSFASLIIGSAAVGKTMLLKRVAFGVAKAGDLVLWLRPWLFQDEQRVFEALFSAIDKIRAYRSKRIVIAIDDPTSFGVLSTQTIVSAAHAVGRQVVLLAAVRTSDWTTYEDKQSLSANVSGVSEHFLAEEFDPNEMSAFPDYLLKLGIAKDAVAARGMLQGYDAGRAGDVLSTLYYLLPATRASIASSVRMEFLRLGDVSVIRNVVQGAATKSSAILKRAYQMVAVADHYRSPVPIEVLVSTLQVDYSEWRESADSKGVSWGILYSEASPDGETVIYRPRNAVVTRLLVEMINGGVTGHAGEVQVLSELLAACTGSQIVYRNFCANVLIKNDQMKSLTYEEGSRLYEVALGALPVRDRSIIHHYALWTKDQGRDVVQATRLLEEALRTAPYPYVERVERPENIHTSYAATIIDGVRDKKVDPDEGRRLVFEHLGKARSPAHFDPVITHVQGNLITKLADQLPNRRDADTYYLFSRGLADIDRALLLLRNELTPRDSSREQVGMLERVRDEILVRTVSLDELKVDATSLWTKYKSQSGFALVCRKLYQDATAKGSGSHYKIAYDYFLDALKLIGNTDGTPSSALLENGVHIYYKWRVSRLHRSTERVDWDALASMAAGAFREGDSKNDPFYQYVFALAKAHQSQWADAEAMFTQLRQAHLQRGLLFTPRDLLLDELGGPRRVQGVVTPGADRNYLLVDELHHDFMLDNQGDWPRAGEIALAYIRFRFAGPMAVSEP